MSRMFVDRSRPRLRPKAHRYNGRFSKVLRWGPYRDLIRRITGADTDSPVDFATALQDWQASKGLKPDGVLGPATWQRMKPVVAPEPMEPVEPSTPAGDEPPDSDHGDAQSPAQDEVGIGFRGRRRCQCASCRGTAELEEEGVVNAAQAPRNSPDYIRWYQRALNGIQDAGLAVDGRRGPRTRAAIRQFQVSSRLPGTGSVGPRTEAALIARGAGAPPSSMPSPSSSSSSSAQPKPGLRAVVDTPLPTNAKGIYSYHTQERQFGTQRTIEAILAIGRLWTADTPQAPSIGIGDISFRGGGKMDGHVSHQKGVDFDVRLMRKDGARRGAKYQDAIYSRELTQKLVDVIHSNGVLKVVFILNNDPEVKRVKPWHGHDDHLHVRLVEESVDQELNEEAACTCMTCRHSESELFEAGTAVNRKSSAYIRWYQQALNQMLPASLQTDGRYGPKTRTAVRVFQQRSGLDADGVVGAATEAALIRAGAPQPPQQGTSSGPSSQPSTGVACGPAASLSQAERDVLSVTSTLEGGKPFHCAVSGVDGISMGSMQWNLKAGTLQNILTQFEKGTGRLAAFFGQDTELLKRLIDLKQTPIADAVAQATAEGLAARWRTAFTQVCADPFFCQLQQRDIASRLCTAWDNFTRLGLGTVRGLSMCYDIVNGDGGGAMAKVRVKALAQAAWTATTESTKLASLANLAADRLGKYREERRARRLNVAGVRTAYRGSPATPPRSFADQINRTVPGLDRSLSLTERTACNPAPQPSTGGGPPPPKVQQGESTCPTPGEMAKGCKSNQRCSPIPDLVCMRAVGNVPIDYLAKFTKETPKRGVYGSAAFKMRPGVRNSIARFLTVASASGLPVERILSQGAYLCRCQMKSDTLSNHGRGEAIDVGGVKLTGSGHEILAINFQTERALVRRLNACLRLAFPRVIDYNYNALHQDHFHCEISIPQRRPKERSTLLFVQELLGIPLSGAFDPATRAALTSFGAMPEELQTDRGLNAAYDRLFLRAAQGGI